MLNIIGAFIISIMILGVLFQRPSIAAAEEKLCSLPLWVHAFILCFLSLVMLQETTNPPGLLSSFSIISWPNWLLDNLNYLIHEAGHVYWAWGGAFLHHLGGTLNEIIFPLVVAFWALLRKARLVPALCLLWLAHNLIGISRYMADARQMKLPIPGGGTHDWNQLLQMMGVLEHDAPISSALYWLGIVLAAVALAAYLALCLPAKGQSNYEPTHPES